MRLFFILLLFLGTLEADTYRAYSENMPPYNYVENGKVRGISTELLKQITKNSNVYIDKIEILPWKRSYDKVLNTKNTILYSTGRSKLRENLFQWVGPIDRIKVGVIAKKSSQIKIDNIQDLNKYKIGTITSSFVEQELVKNGLNKKNIDSFISIESQVKKLVSGRVDAVAFSIPAMCFFLLKLGEANIEYEVIYEIGEAELYFAFNKYSDQEMIKELNTNLKNIDKKYLGNSYTLQD